MGKGGTMLSTDEREILERRLREERERVLESIEDFDEERKQSLQEETGELSKYRLHPADIGTEQMEQEKQFLLASQEGRRLYEIDDSLRRLYADPEAFGTCERCGRAIPFERLEVVPSTRFCAGCQSIVEAEETAT
jgi:DnaK suppressor protein